MACLNDAGYKEAEAIRAKAVSDAAFMRQIAAVAVAIDNAAQLVSNYKKQRDIADETLKISERELNHLKQTYWPRELEFLAEFGTPEDIESAETLGRRYAGRLVSAVADAFAKEIKKADCNAARYCTSMRAKNMQDLMIARSEAIANARVLGRQIGFAEYQARNDRNWDRRLQAIQLGKGLVGQAASLYGKAGQGLAAAGNSIAGRLGDALEFFGGARRDPGPPPISQDMVIQGGPGRMPYNTNSITGMDLTTTNRGTSPLFNQSNNLDITPQVAVGSVDLAYTQDPYSVHRDLQHEKWNEGRVGNRNLVRSGSHTYEFQDSRGDHHSLTINMSDFELQYADHKNPGDK